MQGEENREREDVWDLCVTGKISFFFLARLYRGAQKDNNNNTEDKIVESWTWIQVKLQKV